MVFFLSLYRQSPRSPVARFTVLTGPSREWWLTNCSPSTLCIHLSSPGHSSNLELSIVLRALDSNSLFTFRLIPKRDITNALLLMSFTGVSLWLWRRPHIAGTLPSRRFPWVFLGSSMYVLGSVLMWAIIRSAIGRHPVICITLGLTSSTALTYSAVDYFKYLDKDFEPLEDVMDGTHHSDEEKYDLDI